MSKLRIKDENGKERIHELVDDVTTIGRASTNTIQVSDQKASRSHFRVEKSGKAFKVVDLGSTNGVRLNGVKMSGEAVLKPRDEIRLGKTTFIYEDADAPAPAAESGPVSGGETVELDAVEAAAPSLSSDKDKEDGPKYVLKVLEGKNPGQTYELGVAALTMGRHNSSTIQIIDNAASNYHAEINREPIGYVLSDLGSTNGTRVRHKNKTEFEKIVKTPLSAGMQIRVGKTLLEFVNIGKPAPDEALFGTISLDPATLSAKLADSRPDNTKALRLAAAAALFICVCAGVVYLFRAPPPASSEKPPVASVANMIPNGDFEEASDDSGRPPFFQVYKDSPEVRVSVSSKAAHSDGGDQAKGLQISKGGAKSSAALTVVEAKDSFSVDPSKVYEFKAWMRNEGDGLIGLRVTWIGGGRQLGDSPVVLRNSLDWKEKSALLSPPPWATLARPGVFVQGKEGIASFDALSFRLKPGATTSAPPVVNSDTLVLTYETKKGVFSADSKGARVLENATLQLAGSGKKAESDLISAFDPELANEGGKTVLRGQLFDFQAQDAVAYAIESSRVSSGVDVKIAVNKTGSTPMFSFDLVGPLADGDIELVKSGDVIERVKQGEKQSTGVKNALFNAGGTPQLDMVFGDPVDVEITKGDGKRRTISIRFDRELRLALSSESLRYKDQLAAALKDIAAALDAKKWGDAEAKAKLARDNFAAKFPQARRAADEALLAVEAQWRAVDADFNRALQAVTASPTAETAKAEIDKLQALLPQWAASSKAADLKTNISRIQAIAQNKASMAETEKAEKDAEQWIQDASVYMQSKTYTVAISILNKRIVLDPLLGKTKAAAKAKELLAQMREELDSLQNQLLDKIKPLAASKSAKDWKDAIDIIEKSKDFQKYRAEMPEAEARLKELKIKTAGP
jgi:pSer/pThr/pTyr-binding forkhead associated (FHA) protein